MTPADYLALFIIACFCLAALATVLVAGCCMVTKKRNPFKP